MFNSKFQVKKPTVADGKYPAHITAFDYIEDYKIGVNTSQVFFTSFDILVDGKIKSISVLIFYSEYQDSYCARIVDEFDEATGETISSYEDIVGQFVDLSIENKTSGAGNHYYSIESVSPFTGNKKDFHLMMTATPKSNFQLLLESDDED